MRISNGKCYKIGPFKKALDFHVVPIANRLVLKWDNLLARAHIFLNQSQGTEVPRGFLAA